MFTDDAFDMVYARYFNLLYWSGEEVAGTGGTIQKHEDVVAADRLMVTVCNIRPPNLDEALARVRLRYGVPPIIKQCRILLQRSGGSLCITDRSALLVTLSTDKELRDAFAKHGIYNTVVRRTWVLMRRTSSVDPAMEAVHMIAKWVPRRLSIDECM